jgi:transposase InsO family protein
VERLYQLDARAQLHQERAFSAVRKCRTWDEWHRAFGHIGMSTLEKLHSTGAVTGFDVDEASIPSPTCTSCLGAKLTHQPFPKQADHRSETPGEGVHCDVWGPIRTKSVWGNQYYISFTDDASRYVTLYFMKSKEEAAGYIETYCLMVERKTGKPPAWIRIDNGSELYNQRTKDFCASKGIEIQTTAPYSPSQNGVAERLNRTLLDLVRAMHISGDAPAFLWDEAVSNAVYLRNRVLVRALPGKTPYEAFFGKKPDVSHLREFGCDVWVLDESTTRSKLDPKANKMKFLGFMDGSGSIRYYDAKTRKVKVSRNFAFNNNWEAPIDIPGSSLEEEIVTEPEEPHFETESEHRESEDEILAVLLPSSQPSPTGQLTPTSHLTPTSRIPVLSRATSPIPEPPIGSSERRSTRLGKLPDRDYKLDGNPQARKPADKGWKAKPKKTGKDPKISISKTNEKERHRERDDKLDFVAGSSSFASTPRAFHGKVTMEEVDDPDAPPSSPPTSQSPYILEEIDASLETIFPAISSDQDEGTLPKNEVEALEGKDRGKWEKAIQDELGMLEKMGTWTLEELPEGRKAIGNRWVFATKKDDQGKIIRHKARLVAQGYSQKPGMDFDTNSTFAPVMRLDTFRTITSLAAIHSWKMFQLDVKSAYLNGHLDEEIYMKQPPGFEDDSGRVCKLNRALYGLKQAGNVWNREFNSAMNALGFMQLKTDNCCYIRRSGTSVTILLVWVDDIIGYTSNDAEVRRVTSELASKFEITVIGQPDMLLGMKIIKNDDLGTISLSQEHYIDAMLTRFGLTDANPVSTPLDPNINLDNLDPQPQTPSDTRGSSLFATAIGSLQYAANGTRPDIAYAVNRLAQFTSRPQAKHWTAVKRLFRYLKGTKDHHLTFGGPDNDWSSTIDTFCDADWASNADRKSISGYVCVLAGGAISWSSKKQTSVALSTAEAEYVAATHVAKQVLWLRSLFNELALPQPETSTIFTDNQAAIAIAHNPEFHARTKHIDIALHFLRDLVKARTLDTVYVNTRDNLADVFTKALHRSTHQDLVYRLGLFQLG